MGWSPSRYSLHSVRGQQCTSTEYFEDMILGAEKHIKYLSEDIIHGVSARLIAKSEGVHTCTCSMVRSEMYISLPHPPQGVRGRMTMNPQNPTPNPQGNSPGLAIFIPRRRLSPSCSLVPRFRAWKSNHQHSQHPSHRLSLSPAPSGVGREPGPHR